jgi:hypothetical protein
MLSAAWFSLFISMAALVAGPAVSGGQKFGAVGPARSASAVGVVVPTESPWTPSPTPTPFHRPVDPVSPGGPGPDGRPTCPGGWQLEADGNCHLFVYSGGSYPMMN